MGIEFLKRLPTPTEIKADYPVTQKVARVKAERDAMIRKVFTGESDKFIVIIGPCSADNEEAVCEYIDRLARVQEKVADKLILIPRIYTNKPRTTGEGYKGILHQPDPEKKPDLLHGLIALRKMHMHAVESSGLTAADEKCIFAPFPKQVFSLPMRCFIRKTGDIWTIFSPMWPSVPALLRISSIVW